MRLTEGLAWYQGKNRPDTPLSHFQPSPEDKKNRPAVLLALKKPVESTLFDK